MISFVSVVDELLHLLQVEGEGLLLPQRYGNRFRPHEIDDRFVYGKSRIRVYYLVPLVDEREDGKEENGLGSGRYHDVLRFDLDAPVLRKELGEYLPYLGHPRRWPIVGISAVQGLYRGVYDISGRIEIGFAYLQMDDIPSGGLHGLGPGEHFESRLRAQPAHPFSQHYNSFLLNKPTCPGNRKVTRDHYLHITVRGPFCQ